jgi:putative ABC transport system permease protein
MFGLFRRRRREQDLQDELAAHLSIDIQDRIDAGEDAQRAWQAARRDFGNVTRIAEDTRATWGWAGVEWWLQDVRYGTRLLRRAPAFSMVAVLTLALGTGANTAIFQLMNALRLRPLPVHEPDELVSIGIDQHGKARMGRREVGRSVFTEPLWQEIRVQQQAFSSVFAWASGRWDLSTQGDVVWADGYYMSGSYFATLGVPAQAGRLLTEADDRKGCAAPGAVFSYDFWQARYGGNRSVIGQTISLDRRSFEVIGVAPRGFLGMEAGRAFDVALPLCAEPLMRGREAGTGRRDVWWLDVMGRLKPGWNLERARAHLAEISPALFQATIAPTYTADWAKDYTSFTFIAASGRTGVSMLPTEVHAVLWMLFGATSVVLLLACANLANLMLARATARGPEIAVRLAIGATRRRLVAQLLTESALIAALGAVSGFLLGRWVSQIIVTFLNGGSLPVRIAVDLTPDWRPLALSTLVAVLVCVLCGLAPALKSTRRNPATAMQPGGRSSGDGHDAIALRRGLVVLQIALSIVLVVGALLFVRTLKRLNEVDLGFDPAVLVASVDLGRTAVQPGARMQAFENIVARLRTISGVRYASEAVIVPLSGADWNGRIVKRGAVQHGEVHFNAVGVDYFRAMETPVLRGRTLESRDRPGAPRVAVVNETFARRYFPTEDPIGQTFQVDAQRAQTYSIVGLVRDAKFLQVGEERGARSSGDQSGGSFLPIAYLAAPQEMVSAPATLRIVMRTDVPAPSITPTLTRAITDVAPGAAVAYDAVARYIDTLLLPQRLVAWLSGFFGLLAVLIASIGLYGIMSYLVTRRKIEIGVRMALGAEPGTIIRLILREASMLVVSGLLIGVALAALASQSAESLLYGLEPLDLASFALGTTVLACVGLLAAWLPARRASKVAPMLTLRD